MSLHAHRHALDLGDDDVADVADRSHEADAAHVERLLAEREPLAADVLVGVGERRDQLRQRQVLPLELIGVDLDVILLRVAAEADDVDDAGHLTELLLEDPVLRRLQVGQRVALADDAVAEDLADGVPRRQLRLHVRRQRR